MSDERPIDEPTEDIPEEPSEEVPGISLPHTIGAIRQKLKQARYRHLKMELKCGLAGQPSLCLHNRLRVAPGGKVGMCRCPDMDDEDWPGICDDKITPTMPEECGHFDHARDKEQIKADFREFLSTAPLHEIAGRYPDLAPLIWVLGENAPQREAEVDDWEPGEEFRVDVYGITVTADTAEDARKVETRVADAERGARGLHERVDERTRELEEAREALAAAEEQVVQERERAENAMRDVGALTVEKDRAVQELGELQDNVQEKWPVPAKRGWLQTLVWKWLTGGEG